MQSGSPFGRLAFLFGHGAVSDRLFALSVRRMSCLLLLIVRSDDCRIRWLFPLRHALHLPSVAPCCRRSGQFRDMKTGLCAATRFCTRCCGRRIRSIRFVRICAPIFCFLPSFRAVSGHASKPNCFVRPGFLYGQRGRDRLFRLCRMSRPLLPASVPVGSGMRKPGRRKATRFGEGSVREHCRFRKLPFFSPVYANSAITVSILRRISSVQRLPMLPSCVWCTSRVGR